MTPQEARQILMSKVGEWLRPELFGQNPKYLHVIIEGDAEDSIELARQVALLAHFPSFDEKHPEETATRITILSQTADEEWKIAFGNLLTGGKDWIDVALDVQIECVDPKKTAKKRKFDNANPNRLYVKFDTAQMQNVVCTKAEEEKRLELAKRVNSVYEASSKFEIIRADDVENVHEFDVPVKHFLKQSSKEIDRCWADLKQDERESSLAMADSLRVRIESLKKMGGGKSCMETLTNNLAAMSRSEHARWNVEKLINGFRPYTKDEVIEDENLTGDERTKNIKAKKANRIHNDLCNYSRLRRIDLNSIKYDSFLLLAMVKYWEENINI